MILQLFAVSIQSSALALGGVGLFIVSFLDSSFLSLPEVTDLLLIWMVVHHRSRMIYYGGMATLGSLAGCFVLYLVTKKAGDAFIRRRFKERHIERAFGLFQRYGVLVLLVPSLLPPPSPFKIFVLLAGVVGISPMNFGLAITLGRGLRFFGEAVLALWYGEQAIAFMHAHGTTMFLAVIGAILLIWAGRQVWGRRQQADG
jgi:membrane protein YqaA with SNARE-associated domain